MKTWNETLLQYALDIDKLNSVLTVQKSTKYGYRAKANTGARAFIEYAGLILRKRIPPHMKINYHGRIFTTVSNSPNGQINGDTVFQYAQQDSLLTAFYRGGMILEGHMIGRVNEDNSLYFTYQHIDKNGLLKSGYCNSVPEVLPDGRIRLHEQWEWTYGGEGKGESVVEELI